MLYQFSVKKMTGKKKICSNIEWGSEIRWSSFNFRKKMLSIRMKIRESSHDQKVIYEKKADKKVSL